jgi:hypothetical protein
MKKSVGIRVILFVALAGGVSGCVSLAKYQNLNIKYSKLKDSTINIEREKSELVGENSSLRLQMKAMSIEIENMSQHIKDPLAGVPIVPNPPPANTDEVMFDHILENCKTYIDANKILTDAFKINKDKLFYLAFQGQGFVAAMAIDEIDVNGNKIKEAIDKPQTLGVFLSHLFSREHLDELYFSHDGYYRWVIFIVSPEVYRINGPEIDPDLLRGWADYTQTKFPFDKLKNPIPPDTKLYALLYEFNQSTNLRGKLTLLRSKHITNFTELPIIKTLMKKENEKH